MSSSALSAAVEDTCVLRSFNVLIIRYSQWWFEAGVLSSSWHIKELSSGGPTVMQQWCHDLTETFSFQALCTILWCVLSIFLAFISAAKLAFLRSLQYPQYCFYSISESFEYLYFSPIMLFFQVFAWLSFTHFSQKNSISSYLSSHYSVSFTTPCTTAKLGPDHFLILYLILLILYLFFSLSN